MYCKYQINSNSEDNLNPLWRKIHQEFNKFPKKEYNNIDQDLRTIRVFISSTFKDFFNEREVLIKQVLPKLRRWCDERNLLLIECDLRWGVPIDATNEQAISFCLEEIEKCRQECNNQNFFIGLIGDRFGWVPDDAILISILNKRFQWIESSSVTLMEIVHGAIRTKTDNCIFMMRDTKSFIEHLPDNHKSYFIEQDPSIKMNVESLHKFLIAKFPGNIIKYKPSFDKIIKDSLSAKKDRVILKDYEQFSNDLELFFKNKIETFQKRYLTNTNISFDENQLNFYFLKSKLENSFVLTRENYLYQLINQINANANNKVLLLTGEAGIGKTTLICQLISLLSKDNSVFYHFPFLTNTSNTISSIKKRLIKFLIDNQNLEQSKYISKDDNDETESSLRDILSDTTNFTTKTIICIDALDEIEQFDIQKNFPKCTDKNLTLILSCLESDEFYNKLINKSNSNSNDIDIEIIKLQPINHDESKYLIVDYLNQYGKHLDNKQLDNILKFTKANNPLWLVTVCEELKYHGDYSTLNLVIDKLPDDIELLQKAVLTRLTVNDSNGFLIWFLLVLSNSRAGIYENVMKYTIGKLLNYDLEINSMLWLDLIAQLKSFVQIQSVPVPLIRFRHRIMKNCCTDYVKSSDIQLIDQEELHKQLSKIYLHFKSTNNELYNKDYSYHLILANQRDELLNYMRSIDSWLVFKNSFQRKEVLKSMRCINPVMMMNTANKSVLRICVFCGNSRGQLSLYNINKNSCYLCGNTVINQPNNKSTDTSKILSCSFHQQLVNNCVLCNRFLGINNTNTVDLTLCRTCGFSDKSRCGILIKSNDILYQQSLQFSKNTTKIEQFI